MNHRDPFLVGIRGCHYRCFYCGKFVALDSEVGSEVGSLLMDNGFGLWEGEDEPDEDILFFHKKCKDKDSTK
jgi:hypothetical protein